MESEESGSICKDSAIVGGRRSYTIAFEVSHKVEYC
jgi:hypothetical protein